MTRRLSSGRPARSARPVIDAHGHLLVPEANALADGHPGEAADAAAERASFTEASIAANQAQIRRVWPQLTDVGRRLADLDAIGVDAQIVGPMPMHRYWAEPELAVKLTTVINEAVAAHCAQGQGRLHGLGTLPLQHPAIAVRELERAVGGARPQGRQRLHQRRRPRARRPALRPGLGGRRRPRRRGLHPPLGVQPRPAARRALPRQHLRPAGRDRAGALAPDLRRRPRPPPAG